eukprot:gb/GFBE01047330.1/.p1 GENE.gb/GFBE01047330.1/~~gb/GFBE01047330.1/.p1  ORF type:complete len:341 (+),score=98.97 gb/GFBE01047330.1/:1-1023(+)
MKKDPPKKLMVDFLTEGIKMMKSDSTREMLKDSRAVRKPGMKLIELQRAMWGPLGYDPDAGCAALEKSRDEEIGLLTQEYMFQSMRTYLQALKDRKPAKLETNKAMPREIIIEFFDACNTRMDLPETNEALRKHLAEHNKIPNELIIGMQRDMLEDLGFQQDHGCRMLSNVMQDFPNDKELLGKFSAWQQKATQTCQRAVHQHQASGGKMPQMPSMPIDKDLEAVMEKAKEALSKMSEAEQNKFVSEKLEKKIEVFMKLPPEGRLGYMKRLTEDDKLELMTAQLIIGRKMMKQMEAQQRAAAASGGYGAPGRPEQDVMSAPCTADSMKGPAAAPAQEEMM